MWSGLGSGRQWDTSQGLIRHGFRRTDGRYFGGMFNGYEQWLSSKTWQSRIVKRKRAQRTSGV